MSYFGLQVKLETKEGKASMLSEILLEVAEIFLTRDECHVYLVSAEKNNDNFLWITQVWDSKDDHDKALQKSEIRELVSKGVEYLENPPQKGTELSVLGKL